MASINLHGMFQNPFSSMALRVKPHQNIVHTQKAGSLNEGSEVNSLKGPKQAEKKISINDFNFNDLSVQLGSDIDNHEVNIQKFVSSLNQLNFNKEGMLTSFSDIDFEKTVNGIAAGYTAIKHNIETSSDPNKSQLLNSLDDKFKEAIGRFSKSLSISGNDFFSSLDLNQDVSSKLENSIQKVIEDRVDSFDKFLKTDLGGQFLKKIDGNNVSLQSFSDVMVKNSALIDKSLAQVSDNSKDKKPLNANLFTLNDLKSLGDIESKFKKMKSQDWSLKTEEQFGFELGMLNVSMTDLMQKNEVSEGFSKIMQESFSTFTDSYLKDINKQLEAKAQEADEEFGTGSRYAQLDLRKIKSTMNNVIGQYTKSGDKTQALVDGLDMAKISAYSSAKKSPAMRYERGLSFFDNFYTPNKGNVYEVGRSNYQKYLKDM